MSEVDYHRLLWQQFDKSVANDAQSMFVLSQGQLLNPEDYKPDNRNAGYNTSTLVDSAMKCGVNNAETGSHYSMMWEQLLSTGQGPRGGTGSKVKFDNAKALLYKVYPTVNSDYYNQWLEVDNKYRNELYDLKEQMQEKWGDSWKKHYDERKNLVPSYPKYHQMEPTVSQALDDIEQYVKGIYYPQMKPLISRKCILIAM